MQETTTGIVRRVDELGRVVIPKEIRRTLRIKEGEEMEVSVMNNSKIILKKYSAIKAIEDFETEYAESLYQVTGNNAIICDNDQIVACATDKNIYKSKLISGSLENVLMDRKSVYLYGADLIDLVGEAVKYKDMAISPIIYKGDIIGGVIMVSQRGMGEGSQKLVEVAADFLSRQF